MPKQKHYLSRWISLKLLDENHSINEALKTHLNIDLENNITIQETLLEIKEELNKNGLDLSYLRDNIVSTIISKSEDVRKNVCSFNNSTYYIKTSKIDKILTSKKFGIPIMLLFFALIFWITIVGANYPSQLLSNFFGIIQNNLLLFFNNLHFPNFIINILVYRNISNCNLGCICYASSHGYIFPIIYFT